VNASIDSPKYQVKKIEMKRKTTTKGKNITTTTVIVSHPKRGIKRIGTGKKKTLKCKSFLHPRYRPLWKTLLAHTFLPHLLVPWKKELLKDNHEDKRDTTRNDRRK